MLHLLNSIPQQQVDWQLLGSVLGDGDSVLLYEEAVEIVVSAETNPMLLAWLHQGVKFFVLGDQFGKKTPISKPLIDQVVVVNWDAVVDLVVNEQGVHSL